MKRCSFGDGVEIFPDGENELDPCVYNTVAEYANVTVRVLRCKYCGHTELEWIRQPDTEEMDVDE